MEALKEVRNFFKSQDKTVEAPPRAAFVPEGITNDILPRPVVFISGEREAKVKIPALMAGEVWLPLPAFAEFKDYKYTCRSRYVAGVLRRHCSKSGILEAKD